MREDNWEHQRKHPRSSWVIVVGRRRDDNELHHAKQNEGREEREDDKVMSDNEEHRQKNPSSIFVREWGRWISFSDVHSEKHFFWMISSKDGRESDVREEQHSKQLSESEVIDSGMMSDCNLKQWANDEFPRERNDEDKWRDVNDADS